MRIQKEEIKQDGLILSTLALMTAVSGLINILLINFPSDVLICWILISKWTSFIVAVATVSFLATSILLNIMLSFRGKQNE